MLSLQVLVKIPLGNSGSPVLKLYLILAPFILQHVLASFEGHSFLKLEMMHHLLSVVPDVVLLGAIVFRVIDNFGHCV
jgi:hypothetical protein